MAGHRNRCGGERSQRSPDLGSGKPGFGLGDPDERGIDDRPTHGPAARTDRRACVTNKGRNTNMTAPALPKMVTERGAWDGFRGGLWRKEINVRDFIQQNYEPYDGDESFLAPATERTKKI